MGRFEKVIGYEVSLGDSMLLNMNLLNRAQEVKIMHVWNAS